ncbi:MAG TPA: preprotein translocase subunit SecE [Xanthomonadales bacterium]|nr:preprotein translocase subunit SecE [Xanthomonadales bacterium]
MNAKIEQSEGSTLLDTLKLVVAALLVAGAIVGYYWLDQYPAGFRAAGVILVVLAALGIVALTAIGRRGREFLAESHFELRKVVWPTRQETIQTTIVVIIVVMILSIILWLIDLFLGWVILDKLLGG